MPQFTSLAVDGTGGISSITQDPFRPVEFGRGGKSGADATNTETLAVGDELIIRVAGEGYTAGTDIAVTNVTAADNDYGGDLSPGAGLTVDITVGTAAQGSPTDAVVRAIVNTVPTTDYNQGDLISVNGNAAGEDDCILMIPGPDYDAP